MLKQRCPLDRYPGRSIPTDSEDRFRKGTTSINHHPEYRLVQLAWLETHPYHMFMFGIIRSSSTCILDSFRHHDAEDLGSSKAPEYNCIMA